MKTKTSGFFREKFPTMLKNFFTNNIGYKILAIVMGIGLWGFLSNAQDPITTQTLTIPINYINADRLIEDEKLIIMSRPETIQIEVERKQSNARYITPNLFTCTADVLNHKGDNPESQTIRVSVTQVSGSSIVSAWRYVKDDPNIVLEMDNYKSKTLPVTLEKVNELPKDYKLEGNVVFNPYEITVSGPEKLLNNVKMLKGVLDLSQISISEGGTIKTEVPVIMADEDGREISNESGFFNLSSTTVMLSTTLDKITEVNIVVAGVTGNPAEGYRFKEAQITPQSVQLQGQENVFEEGNEIQLPSKLFDVTGASEDLEVKVDLKSFLPKGTALINEKDSTVKVKLILEKQETRKFTLKESDVKIRNMSENLEYSIASFSEDITMIGFSEDLEKFTLEQLAPSVDAKDLSLGTYQLKVTFQNTSSCSMENPIDCYVDLEVKEKNKSADKQD